ncbi:MAG: heat-inducible transcriptional repressor HrcA [Cyanobacteria bacterium]|nr:heat-inducible transcriptional repressor HrcA [Cyanobacteria bacterium CG_2015-16_32_12]NCO77259.1 heat-inducible transcriptional repressor HrcA [Cyanobacteria bacterium CG_2015-22_32_23]NCQ05422.1 heat-inducible transcriptional repressor HrcA [Cyanobacteria bacterium CG_2015-09_32_10]NCQ42702.1 heat-inducible transcriptional repressor HrcA [Cyanobacteria bacterium CG_2015-04_32_10]NCS86121.1 heat-inducible transcriptional repressor HrcA [Cyanobacteria bacterium CG_2015-02_32_10]
MTVQITLNERHQKILQATVKHYIATAEPVGSKTLINEYDFSISSATIRNVLGKLEKAGFLYQPYTSAGRIPSDSGYRAYVDQLINIKNSVKFPFNKFVDSSIKNSYGRYEILFQKITNILADLSGCIALITLPQIASNILYHLQLLRVADDKIMLVMVIDNYQTESILLETNQLKIPHDDNFNDVIDRELEILSNFLNHKLKGEFITKISNLDWSELNEDFYIYADFINNLLTKIKTNYRLSNATPILIQGFSKLVQQPEFSHIEQVKILLNLLEKEQDQLLPLVFNVTDIDHSSSEVNIRIGSENPLESMQFCSLISAYYYQGEYPAGSVGIIGPTRMAYEETIALVQSTANYLSQTL